jgi:hypothetical protein
MIIMKYEFIKNTHKISTNKKKEVRKNGNFKSHITFGMTLRSLKTLLIFESSKVSKINEKTIILIILLMIILLKKNYSTVAISVSY